MNYIAIEGADGTGKTTLAKAVAERLENKGKEVFHLYEPYGETEVTKKLREFCLDKKHYDEVNWRARELMLLASRAISTKKVKDYWVAHPDGTIVTDRSIVSGMVYAHVASGMNFWDWAKIANVALWELPNIIVHVSVDKTNINITEGDIYDDESTTFHKMIKETFPPALNYIETMSELGHKDLKVIEFKNDFNLEPNNNAERLLTELQGVGNETN